MRKHRKRRVCPVHGIDLVKRQTQYGPCFVCQEPSCTVLCWKGRTSTPADAATRKARSEAHAAFDPLWRSRGFGRSVLYKKLASYMGLSPQETHIGYFNKGQCEKVLEFVKALRAWVAST